MQIATSLSLSLSLLSIRNFNHPHTLINLIACWRHGGSNGPTPFAACGGTGTRHSGGRSLLRTAFCWTRQRCLCEDIAERDRTAVGHSEAGQSQSGGDGWTVRRPCICEFGRDRSHRRRARVWLWGLEFIIHGIREHGANNAILTRSATQAQTARWIPRIPQDESNIDQKHDDDDDRKLATLLTRLSHLDFQIQLRGCGPISSSR